MGRAPCCDKASVKKGPWSPEEDAKLKDFIEKFGTGGNWIALPQKAGLKRCGKSCRLRWLNYLRPNIRHGEFSDDEDRIIYSLYATIGSRWSVIAAQLPGRTDNDIKNYWNTKLKKKLLTMLPSFHQEKPTFLPSSTFQPPPYDLHHASSFYSYTPNFMNVDNNTSNSLFVHDNHFNGTDHHSPPPPQPANNNFDNFHGFPDDHCYHSMCNSQMQAYFDNASTMKEGMLMFGSTTCSSSEGGSSMSHGNNYTKDHHLKHQYQVKQKVDQMTLHDQVLGDDENQMKTQSFMIKNHVSPLNKDLQELNQVNLNGYLFHDGDGNKTTYNQKGMCSYYY